MPFYNQYKPIYILSEKFLQLNVDTTVANSFSKIIRIRQYSPNNKIKLILNNISMS